MPMFGQVGAGFPQPAAPARPPQAEHELLSVAPPSCSPLQFVARQLFGAALAPALMEAQAATAPPHPWNIMALFTSPRPMLCDAPAAEATQAAQLEELTHAHEAQKAEASATPAAVASAAGGRRQAVALNISVVGAADLGKSTAVRRLFRLPAPAPAAAAPTVDRCSGTTFYADILPELPAASPAGAASALAAAPGKVLSTSPTILAYSCNPYGEYLLQL